jgi:hypothetical protein
MIAYLPLWRFMAWIGVTWRSLKVGKEEGEVRWQDKTGAVCVGAVLRVSAILTASHTFRWLAAIPENNAIQPFSERLRVYQ